MLELDHIKIRSHTLLRAIGIDQVQPDRQKYFPRFLVSIFRQLNRVQFKVSHTYYIKVGDYTHAFLLDVNDKMAAKWKSFTEHKKQLRRVKKTLKHLVYDDITQAVVINRVQETLSSVRSS